MTGARLCWIVIFAAFVGIGCNSGAPTQTTRADDQPRAPQHPRREMKERGQPGVFDYYVFTLSWSPEFCHSHADAAECSGHLGFVVHGLWPQYVDGYPENCSTEPGLADPASMTDIIPDAGLVVHEWKTHGTCSGLDADAYFKTVRQAYGTVKIPSQVAAPQRGLSITPDDLKEDFLRANPRLKAEDMTVSCGNNWLTAVSFCMDKQLQPRACEGLRDCRANVIRVAPVR